MDFPNDSQMTITDSEYTLDLSSFSHLKSFECGDSCFNSVNRFIVSGLNQLESIRIGVNSFVLTKNTYTKILNREFHLRNCSSLTELTIGQNSFSDYYVFELENLPNLKSISIGSSSLESFNFYYVENVEFINLPSLETLDFGHSSFYYVRSIRLESLMIE